MNDEIVMRGFGFLIARAQLAETQVPYAYQEREDGSINHGFIDLRDKPNSVSLIPEAKKSEGLANLLTTVADVNSPLMTAICEAGCFDSGPESEDYKFNVGGFVNLMFRQAVLNRDEERMLNLAIYVLEGIPLFSRYVREYDFTIEPLKKFFDEEGCYALQCKTLGHGRTEDEAWLAFDSGTQALADAVSRDQFSSEVFKI